MCVNVSLSEVPLQVAKGKKVNFGPCSPVNLLSNLSVNAHLNLVMYNLTQDCYHRESTCQCVEIPALTPLTCSELQETLHLVLFA